jgi:hypothetical protein
MRYVLLLYGKESAFDTLAPAEMEAVMGEFETFTNGIVRSGHYKAGEQLENVDKAASLRYRNGRLDAVDGPFAETKEQLGGFYLIDAKDMAEAKAIAARIPVVKWGTVEIRPVVMLPEG